MLRIPLSLTTRIDLLFSAAAILTFVAVGTYRSRSFATELGGAKMATCWKRWDTFATF